MCRKRIIAWFGVFVICFSAIPIARAEEYVSKTSNYWEYLMHGIIKGADSSAPMFKAGIQSIASHLEGDICELSEDGYHYGDHLVAIGSTPVEDGRYMARAICKFCNKEFNCYASDLQQSYDTQVNDLKKETGTTTVTADGYLFYFYPDTSQYYGYEVSDLATVSSYTETSSTFLTNYVSKSRQICFYYDFSPLVKGNSLLGNFTFVQAPTCSVSDPSSVLSIYSSRSGFCTGFDSFSLYYGDRILWYKSDTSGNSEFKVGETVTSGLGPYVRPSAFVGPCNVFQIYVSGSYGTSYVTFNFTPLIISYQPIDLSGTIINNINSRPTSITGDYGIIGDNGQITKIEGNTIVNETDNTVYNPVTNTTSNVTDWQYDYSTRTYNLTLDNGTTSTVTYGDENVTIVESDTTYNVYYLVEDTGTDTPAPCNHSWTETSTTPATCTVPGSRLLTCSLCGQTKTEATPAPGHSWVIRQTVNTEYDETGNKTQEGYTIFECSVCGEQYKTTDGGAPPGGGTAPGSGSSGGVFSGIFGLLVDFLGFFWNTFRGFVGEGVKGFLAALMDGTSPIFGLLNPFDWGG